MRESRERHEPRKSAKEILSLSRERNDKPTKKRGKSILRLYGVNSKVDVLPIPKEKAPLIDLDAQLH